MANENGNGNGAMKGLSSDKIAELLAGGRSKGVYGKYLHEFLENSDEAGINPREVWPLEFKDKPAGAMYQSFRNAAIAAKLLNVDGKPDTLAIFKRENDLFIIHRERAAAAAEVEA